MAKAVNESKIDNLVAGRPMDGLVARLVFGWQDSLFSNMSWQLVPLGGDVEKVGNCPRYSTEWEYASHVLDGLEELVTRFSTGDGFTHLTCGHFADHGECVTEKDSELADEPELDPEPWSAHIHVGLIGENDKTPQHWKHEEWFCARGATGPEAICKSAIKAFDPEFVRTHFYGHLIVDERLRQIKES